MDEERQNLRGSGIPRLSKLPVPNRIPTLRPSPSRESISGPPGELRNPKLRSTPSRDSLPPQPTLRKRESVNGSLSAKVQANPPSRPRVPSRQTPRSARSPDNPTSRQRAKTPLRETGDGTFKRPPPLSRRPSAQFSQPPTPTSELLGIADSPRSVRDKLEVIDTDGGITGLDTIRAKSSKPRPSLSERTIETLSQIPSSPAMKGKASAFFDPESQRRPPSRPGSRGSRPGSSYQSESSNRTMSRPQSRPGSSSGQDDGSLNFRASMSTLKAPLTPIDGTPSARGRLSLGPGPRATPSRVTPGGTLRSVSARLRAPPEKSAQGSRTPSPDKQSRETPAAKTKYGAKTIAGRPVKARPSLNGLFRKPSVSNLEQAATSPVTARKSSLVSQNSSTSYEETNPSSASTTSTVLTVDSAESASMAASRKSSAALREQIAKAKAARRAASRQVSSSAQDEVETEEAPVVPTDTTFDFGLASDPFGQNRDNSAKEKIVQSRIASARTTGRLNIAALGLREIPADVMNMYDMESTGKNDGSWAESVDLTRFVAADNEIEMIEDAIFPDQEPQELANEEDGRGNIFGGLETLDLHGNMLICLPMGLRRLSLLTSLNLSQNRITNNSLEVISQITSLRDLKLGGNLFYGPLDPSFSKLENLEIADLHGNNISALPLNVENMSKLRILNISENNFESLLFEPLSKLPLTELLARKNKLSGVLIEDAVASLPSIQILDVSSNQITHIASTTRTEPIEMPALHQLCVSMNRLQGLPDVSRWTSLLTLAADENGISSFPDGFTSLTGLRHVDFSSNDIRVIPPEVGRMDNLVMLRLSGNPLRDKKFCTATTDDLKAALAARLEPLPVEAEPEAEGWKAGQPAETAGNSTAMPTRLAAVAEGDAAAANEDQSDSRSDDDFATPPTSAPHSPARSRSHTVSSQNWPVKSGGVLDRSETESSSLHPVVCSRIAAEQTIREIYLHRNLFTVLPDSLSFFADSLTILSLARNKLVGESYLGDATLSDGLDLPSLKELNLSSNHITGLVPLASHLRAPALQKLDVSLNRISSLPPGAQLKTSFPSLEVLLVSNNHLGDLDPDSIAGLRVVDVSNNDIEHLNPRIGLLGGTGGLERFEVMGNRFRVPRYNVIERGTEATLRWLRGRVPVAEMGAWREANNQRGDGDLEDVD